MNMQQKIEEKLQNALKPEILEVINESHLHAGHAGDDGSGESHFRLVICSHNFKENSRVGQQREIFNILKEEMDQIHALSIQIQ
jgi:BolA protein